MLRVKFGTVKRWILRLLTLPFVLIGVVLALIGVVVAAFCTWAVESFFHE